MAVSGLVRGGWYVGWSGSGCGRGIEEGAHKENIKEDYRAQSRIDSIGASHCDR